jgi:hypothetical protein
MPASQQPMFIAWGPERITLSNDGCAEILQAKHPAIGPPFEAIWPDIWDDVTGFMARVHGDEAVRNLISVKDLDRRPPFLNPGATRVLGQPMERRIPRKANTTPSPRRRQRSARTTAR